MSTFNIKGGILGAVIGAIFAGPLGAILGIGLGMRYIRFDDDDDTHRLNEQGEEDDAEYTSSHEEQAYLSDYSVELFFRCLGKIAKSDGRVSEDEAEFVRELMTVWEMAPDKRRRMGLAFNKGRDTTRTFLSLVQDLANALNAEVCSRKARRTLVQILCALVVVDRVVHPAERRMLNEAGCVLGVQDCVEAFFAETDAQDAPRHRPEPPQDALRHAYELLGIPPTATDDEVKSAYRRKAKEFHPDRAEGAGLSAAFIQRAKEQFQALGNAYDTIRAHRGMN